jgi:3-dehydroquinate synthetase
VRAIVDGLSYPIVIATEGPAEVAAQAARAGVAVAVVADRAVEARAREVVVSLKGAGCEVRSEASILAGERRKRWKSVTQLHDRWAADDIDRECLVIAIGGGTTTDVVGFAAATYLRGVRWLPVATTVVGMVDAAIGGKTGIDLPQGKNLVGAFWQPVGVVGDLGALESLAPKLRGEGVAEMVKAAIIGDPDLLRRLEQASLDAGTAAWGALIAAAAAVKVRIVAVDPGDRNGRTALNLGHTFGHALEQASRYRLNHGAAVALGLRAAGILARGRTGWSQADQRVMLRVLRRYRLPARAARLDSSAILEAMHRDKKRRDGTLRFVLPVRLGEVRNGVEVSEGEVLGALEELTRVPERTGY